MKTALATIGAFFCILLVLGSIYPEHRIRFGTCATTR